MRQAISKEHSEHESDTEQECGDDEQLIPVAFS
jgi:hypothetical protein